MTNWEALQQPAAFGYWGQLGSVQGYCGGLGGLFGGGVSTGWREYPDWRTLNPNEWHSWMYCAPPDDKLIQWTRNSWNSPHTGYAHELRPEDDISDLRWRLTGIAKHEMEDKWWTE